MCILYWILLIIREGIVVKNKEVFNAPPQTNNRNGPKWAKIDRNRQKFIILFVNKYTVNYPMKLFNIEFHTRCKNSVTSTSESDLHRSPFWSHHIWHRSPFWSHHIWLSSTSRNNNLLPTNTWSLFCGQLRFYLPSSFTLQKSYVVVLSVFVVYTSEVVRFYLSSSFTLQKS